MRMGLTHKLRLAIWFMAIPLIIYSVSIIIITVYINSNLNSLNTEKLNWLESTNNLFISIRDFKYAINHSDYAEVIGLEDGYTKTVEQINKSIAKLNQSPYVLNKDALRVIEDNWAKVINVIESSTSKGIKLLNNPSILTLVNEYVDQIDNQLRIIYKEYQFITVKDYENILELKNKVLPILIITIFITLGIEILASIFIVRSLILPTYSLAKAVRQFEKGDFSYRIRGEYSGEVGELVSTFNSMADKLQASYRELKNQAIYDGLTNVYNQREFLKRLESAIKRARRYDRNLSLIMMDVDHFKEINDTLGHRAGDAVLKTVGEYLRAVLRSSDEPGRYGGDEFAIIVPETTPENVMLLATRVKQGISNLSVALDSGNNIKITVSIGVAHFSKDGSSVEELISSADRALYKSKMLGRNQVSSL